MAVMVAIKAAQSLRYNDGDFPPDERNSLEDEARALRVSEDRHKGFFAYRRAEVLASNDATFLQDPSHAALIARVAADFAEVNSYVAAKFQGANSLGLDAPDGPSTPSADGSFQCDPDKHLDLSDVSRQWSSETAPNNARLEEFRSFRLRAAKSIVWRAAALEANVWNEQTTQSTHLRSDSLDTVLDRRLRTVERMHAQVNGAAHSQLTLGPNATKRGPWLDGSRVRPFDYPELSQANLSQLTGTPPEPFWVATNAPHTLAYVDNNATVISGPALARFDGEPDTTSPVWEPALLDAYARNFNSSGSTALADAVGTLMKPALDFWGRRWVYCDHVCTILHLDALRFGLLRKTTHSDDAFNAIPGSRTITLSAMLGLVPDAPDSIDTEGPITSFLDSSAIFRGGAAPWFENRFVTFEKLQVGDQLIFWNHALYTTLFDGAWRLENAVITAIESDPVTGGVLPLDMKLEGHGADSIWHSKDGTIARPVPGLARYADLMATGLNQGLKHVRKQAQSAEGADLDQFLIHPGGTWTAVVRWSPYPGISKGSTAGPWFVFMRRTRDSRSDWSSIAGMLTNIRYATSDDTSPGAGYQARPTTATVDTTTVDMTDGVLFPLYLPQVAGETRPLDWSEYFERRRRTPNLNVTLVEFTLESPDVNQLEDAHEADPSLNPAANTLTGDVPGLFVGGSTTLPIQVLRPKAGV
jgi:hypothetical protein